MTRRCALMLWMATPSAVLADDQVMRETARMGARRQNPTFKEYDLK